MKDINATYDSFMTYVKNLPTTKGVGKKKLGLSHFNEYDGVTTLEGITGTLSCRNVQNYCLKYLCDDGIYKPSPKMCYRLMGFSDDDFEKSRVALNDNDHQLYDRAGNSIVVDVPLAIYRELFKDKKEMLEDFNVLSLFSGIGAFEKALDEYYNEVM